MSEKGETPKMYPYEVKRSAVQLSEKIGAKRAAAELDIPVRRIYAWRKAARERRSQATAGSQTRRSAEGIMKECDALRKRIKILERENYILSSENNHLRSLNDFLSSSLREDDKESPAP